MRKVIIMQGVSGSGKSTYARNLVSNYSGSSAIVSADDFFLQPRSGGCRAFNSNKPSSSGPTEYVFDATKLGEAHAWCFREFVAELSDETELVIVDNTNSTPVEIAPYMLGASAFGYEAKIVRVLCSPKLAYERGKHGVSYDAILDCIARIDNSEFPPWWVLEKVDGEASVTRMMVNL